VIVAAGLPLDVCDLGLGTEVVERLGHQVRDGPGVGAVGPWIGHEPTTSGERRQEKRAEAGHRDGIRGLSVGAQLSVAGGEELFGVRH
jgi:hypothetical protein